ncbi:MAG TPA: FG-GAP repeat protein [Steroidobacter sp.]
MRVGAVVVAASFFTIATVYAAGAFRRPPTILISQYELHEPTNSPKPQAFGTQVALSRDGRTLAISDPWYFGGPEWPWYGSGAVYVFTRTNGAWALQARLEAPNPRGYDDFGSDLSLSGNGDTLAIGAQYEGSDDAEPGTGEGSVFIFHRRGRTWSAAGYIRSPAPESRASFGRSVELSASGKILVVGAPYQSRAVDGVSQVEAGAVYVFRQDRGRWSEEAVLRSDAPESFDRFGIGLRLSEDGRTLAVLAGEQNPGTEDLETGTWGDRNNTLHVFARRLAIWRLETKIEGLPSEPFFAGSGYDTLGQSEGFDLSGDGNMLAVASPSGVGPDGETGYVTLYRRVLGHWVPSDAVLAPSLTGRLHFGLRVTLSSDGSMLAAAANRDEGPYGRPYVVIFQRQGRNWSEVAALEPGAWPDYTTFGNSIAISRTGKHIAIGSSSYTTDTSFWGAAFAY